MGRRRHRPARGRGATRRRTSRFALALYAVALALGFRPLLYDSNGRGGYHLVLLFDGPVPTETVFAFLKWLIRDWEAAGLAEAPETFPKQADAQGRRVRQLAPARRAGITPTTTSPASGTVERWLEGSAAIRAHPDDRRDVGRASSRPRPWPPPKPRGRGATRPAGERADDARLAKEALAVPRPGLRLSAKWLEVGMSLTPLGERRARPLGRLDRGEPAASTGKGSATASGGRSRRAGPDPRHALPPGQAAAAGRGAPVNGKAMVRSSSHGTGAARTGPAAIGSDGDGPGRRRRTTPTPRAEVSEAPDDPHRLARLFRDEHYRDRDGLKLRYWQGDYVAWDGAYRASPRRTSGPS